MIKNLMGKKESKPDSINDEEVQKLREKFNNIVSSDNEEKKEPSSQPINNPNAAQTQQPQQNYQYVDPQKAEDNERITNLIMQQIKELIEIDNNLNAKNKELEVKISDNSGALSETKSIVEQFNSRLEMIEKNMEKFMGLYEVVTNRFNPFVSEEQKDSGSDIEVKGPKVAVVEDAIKDEKNIIEDEVKEIIVDSGIREKLVTEQQSIIHDELTSAIEAAGAKAETDEAKKELSTHISSIVSGELKKAMENHIRLSNDDLKKTIKDMLIETISQLKETPKKEEKEHEKVKTPEEKPEEEVHPDYHFYLSDGTPIKSVVGLKNALDKMDDKTFTEHVNEKKNDFSDWIRVVLKNDDIADKIAGEKTKAGIKTVLETLK